MQAALQHFVVLLTLPDWGILVHISVGGSFKLSNTKRAVGILVGNVSLQGKYVYTEHCCNKAIQNALHTNLRLTRLKVTVQRKKLIRV